MATLLIIKNVFNSVIILCTVYDKFVFEIMLLRLLVFDFKRVLQNSKMGRNVHNPYCLVTYVVRGYNPLMFGMVATQ